MDIFDASYQGNVRRVRELLQSGVSVNTQNGAKNTPLIKAAWNNILICKLSWICLVSTLSANNSSSKDNYCTMTGKR